MVGTFVLFYLPSLHHLLGKAESEGGSVSLEKATSQFPTPSHEPVGQSRSYLQCSSLSGIRLNA